MPRVSDEHRTAMRRRIQDATIEVVRRKGMAGLTMGDVIAESGLSAGAIYGYYRGKYDIVADVSRTVMGSRRDVVLELAGRDPVPAPVEAVGELLATLPRSWIEGGLLLQMMGAASSNTQVLEAAQGMLAGLHEALEAYVHAYLRQEGLPDAEARARAVAAAPVIVSMAQGYVLQCSLVSTVDHAAYARGLEVVLGGGLARSAGADHARVSGAPPSPPVGPAPRTPPRR